MFRENTNYQQPELFGISHQLTKKQLKLFEQSVNIAFLIRFFV